MGTKKTPEELKAIRQETLAKARQVRLDKIKAEKENNMKRNVKLIHAFEQLDAIEAAKGEEKIELLKQYGTASPLNFLLSLNYRSDIKLEIPEGLPPTIDPKDIDTVTHPDLIGILGNQIKRLLNCRVETQIPKFKKEKMFIEIMMACPWKDAQILCACKDKALSELYPTITRGLVQSVFPAYVK